MLYVFSYERVYVYNIYILYMYLTAGYLSVDVPQMFKRFILYPPRRLLYSGINNECIILHSTSVI